MLTDLAHGFRMPLSPRNHISEIGWLPSAEHCSGKHTPTSVRRRSSRVDFRLRNPSSPDVVFVMKALFSILDPQNRVETNTCFVFAHDFVLALRYLHFFPLLTYITDSNKFLRCLLFTDGRLQLQHSNTSTKSVKRRMLKHQRSSRVDFRARPMLSRRPNFAF